jgi:hypothetical protein
MQPVAAILSNPTGFRSTTPDEDKAAVNRVADVEQVQKLYNPLSVIPLVAIHRRLPDGSPEFEAFAQAHRRLLLQNMDIFLAERTHMFAGTIGFNNWGYASLLSQPGRRDRAIPPVLFDTFSDMAYAPIIPAAANVQEKVLASVQSGPGWTNGFLLWFTAFPGLCLLVVALVAGIWFPVTAIASLLVASQVAALYAVNLASDFRFFYFLYLYQLLIIPMIVTEWRARGWNLSLTKPT